MFEVSLALFFVAAVAVAASAVPVAVDARIERTDVVRANIRLLWLFGLVNVQLNKDRGRRAAGRPASSAPARACGRRRHRRSRRRMRPAAVLSVVRSPGFLRRLRLLVRDVGRRFRVEDVFLDAEFGLDDPADTGRLYGALAPLLVAARANGRAVWCRPSFLGACLRGSCGGRVRVRPLSLLATLLAFICSIATLRAMRAAWVSLR